MFFVNYADWVAVSSHAVVDKQSSNPQFPVFRVVSPRSVFSDPQELRMSAAAGAEVDGVSLDTITELDTKIQSLEQVKIEANIIP